MKIRLLLLMLLLYVTSWAQQDALFVKDMYNVISINPVCADSPDVISIFGLHRSQWTGLDEVPMIDNISIQSPINN